MTAIVAKNGVCQPGAEARKLKAAPLLKTSTMLKKPVTGTLSPGWKCPSTASLLARSRSTTSAARPYQYSGLGIAARLARSVQVGLAAAAQARAVHVGPVVPAALALRMPARDHIDGHRRSVGLVHACARGDEDEPEVVLQSFQGLERRPVRLDVELGRERGADLLLLALFFDSLGHDLAELPDVAPVGEHRLVQARPRQDVPHLFEHAFVRILREHLPRLLRGEAEDRRHQAQQALRDVPERGLRGAARPGVGPAGVKPVF